MGHEVEVETMENDRETDDVAKETCSGSDEDALQQQQQLNHETERAILERVAFKKGKSDAATTSQETLAMQTQVSGGRVTARKRLEVAATGYESPLFASCFKILFEMTDGAYRDTSADLMEFLSEELAQVQKRCQALVQVGGDTGYGSREFQRAVETWRASLDMASDPAYQAKNVWGAVTFETTLERLRQKKKRKHADAVDVYRQSCERLTMELLDGAVRTPQPLLLLQLLLEDFHHVQRRQQALFRAESASAETMTLTAGGLTLGRESVAPSCARSPFTPTQWQDFEHQALIFKYMVAGVRLVNVPDEIMASIRNSCSSIPAPNGFLDVAVTYDQVFDVVFEGASAGAPAQLLASTTDHDPEPGRCRRTDGKKWRCARETVPEKKYCERHMHRGRHRSSRPETQTTTTHE